MAQLRSNSYAHRCHKLGDDYYRINWTVDYKPAGSRIRYPRNTERFTDEKGARKFCKKWDLDFPEVSRAREIVANLEVLP